MPIFVRDANGNIVSVPTLDDISFATSAQLADLLSRMPATPHSQPLTDAQLRASAVPVSGNFFQATQPISALSLPLPSGASTDATLTQVRDRLPVTAHSQPLTDAQLRATAVPVSLSSAPLPTGAATQATLASVLSALQGTLAMSASSLPLPTGAATQATLAQVLSALQAALSVNVGNFPSDFPATSTVAKMEQVRALLAAALNVTVSNFPTGGAQEATLTQVRDRLPATAHEQPLTNSELRAAPLAKPDGVATEAKQDTISSLVTEIRASTEQNKSLIDTLLYFTAAVLDKMPQLTSTDDARVQMNGGTLSTLTTATTVGTLNNLAGGNVALIPWQLGAGAFHIYNQITVTTP